MKKSISILTILATALALASCSDLLNVSNPNSQTTGDFGSTEADLREAVIACYNHTRMEGTFSRVGYTLDLTRGDEVWNASQVWYLPYDDLNSAPGDEISSWIWRDWYYTINRCNYVINRASMIELSDDAFNEIVGQAYFLRGLAYYELATYFQTVPKFTDYSQYSSLESVFSGSAPQDEILDLVEEDLNKAMTMLPSRNKGGEWANGRATCGAAAGYYARALMFRHKYSEALKVLEDIIGGTYGTYALVADFGDNFREGAAYENNQESLYEIQFMDSGKQGADEEWTPVNNSKNATNAHAVESNFAPRAVGGWADLSLTSWVYNLFKAERCTDGRLDPRLYWTAATYEAEYDSYTNAATAAYPGGDPRKNEAYTHKLTAENQNYIGTNQANGGIPIAKWTNARMGNAEKVVVGLHCGINLRLMRYSDVLLRAAECENEVNGPTTRALGWINEVRNRAALADLPTSGWTKDKLFEQIANVERPKEFAAENGRGIDLLRWGFFYNDSRRSQIEQHNAIIVGAKMVNTTDFDGNAFELDEDGNPKVDETTGEPVRKTTGPIITDYPITEATAAKYEGAFKSSLGFWTPGHEYFPVFTAYLNANPYLSGNSANNNSSNAEAWRNAYGEVHPVVSLD